MFSKSSFYSGIPQQRKCAAPSSLQKCSQYRKMHIIEETSFPLLEFKFKPRLVFDKAKPNSIYFFIFLKMHKCDMVLTREKACYSKQIMGFGINQTWVQISSPLQASASLNL